MILLDTCTLLWLASDQTKLSSKAKKLIEFNSQALFVSAISAFELAIKHVNKKLSLPLDPAKWYKLALEQHGISEIAIDGSIGIAAARLPLVHRDPADRIIIATAQSHKLSILSPDSIYMSYSNTQVAW